MSDVVLALALHFIRLTGPNEQSLDIAVDQIVSLRQKPNDEHFASNTNCLVHTTDGKFIAVKETCKEVEQRLDALYHSREEE